MWYKDTKDSLVKIVDRSPLWILGLIIMVVLFVPYILLGEGSVFSTHDQLDETICAYLLNARHMFDGSDILPEMMGGISKSGLQPSAVLFIPLYRFFPLYTAFLLQYFIVTLCAFGGMYGLIRKITESNGIALIIGLLFAMLPFKPIYGLSVMGVPLVALCFTCLYEHKNIIQSLAGIIFFGLTTHLVLIGYVILTYLGILLLYLFWKHRGRMRMFRPFILGTMVLAVVYCAVNYELFTQLILGTGDFVSHREEFVNNTEGINSFLDGLNIFLYGESEYAPTFHWKILPVIGLVTAIQSIRYKKLSDRGKQLLKLLLLLWIVVIINAVLYGFLKSAMYMEWKNQQNGFFRYFQSDRYYWIYPALWWTMIGVALALVWREFPQVWESLKVIILVCAILPTIILLKNESNLYDNLNEYNHGSLYTGLVNWREYYMQDVLKEVDAYIGRDKREYKVVHVGFNPSPSLVYGFYTVDGYSNNYSLEYKHRFRKVIEKELDKSSGLASYFDTWGNRCCLFNAEGTLERKDSEFVYHNLEFDVNALKELGCEYIFSSSEINGSMQGIALEGVFDTDESIYRVWLYKLDE